MWVILYLVVNSKTKEFAFSKGFTHESYRGDIYADDIYVYSKKNKPNQKL
jgi:hypothetical protein